MGFRVGQYVNHNVTKSGGDPELQLSRLSGGKDDAWEVQPVDKKFKDTGSVLTGVKDADLKAAGLRKFASRTGGDQIVEVLTNSAIYSAGQALFRKGRVFGHETMSFATADFIYEFIAKYYVESMFPDILPDVVPEKEQSWFASGDLQDALKALPIVVIQQIICRIAYRHKFGHKLLHQLIDAFGSISVANFAGRNASAQRQEKKAYKW